MTFAVIADDLTGASDAGVQFTRAGHRTAVSFWGAPPLNLDSLDAVVLDTDSRALEPSAAVERVANVGREAAAATFVYKKLDSTLRGPIAAELAAAFKATGRKCVVIAPAFPRVGRTTVNAVQLLHGVPIHKTELAHDSLSPVRESHLPTLLRGAFKTVTALSLQYLRDATVVRRALETATVVVVDALTDDDLAALVHAVPNPGSVLWAGSAGLADALSQTYTGPHQTHRREPRTMHHHILVIVGSVSTTSREQLARLEQAGDATCITLRLQDTSSATVRAEVGRVTVLAKDALEQNQVVALTTVLDGPQGIERASLAQAFAAALADVSVRLAARGLVDALVLTGGDTAASVARHLGARGILLEEELAPGVALGTLIGERPYHVVTKAGGFGEPDTLRAALHALRQPGGS